jgi:outer membrane receptor protein involved in Fe transport
MVMNVSSNFQSRAGVLLGKASVIAMTALFLAQPNLAIAQSGTDADVDAASAQDNTIIVTAQRRSERIIDVPYNISAVSGDDLTTAGATNANDLVKVVAGLGNFSDGPIDSLGENNFSMRGLRTDPSQSFVNKYTVSSVSTYLGDVPVFAALLLKDLERVEVLRGPQGTLYGSGAQGGAIRFIPKRPTFDGTSGEINVSSGITQHAARPNYSVDGAINLPLADNLALRISGAYVDQAGYIDQVNLFELDANGVPVPSVAGDLASGPVIAPVKKNTNSWNQWIVRPMLRFQPTDWLDLELAYIHQRTHSNDSSASNPAYPGGVQDWNASSFYVAVDPTLSSPNSSYLTRPGGTYKNTQQILQPATNTLDLGSFTAAADLGFATLSSITSYYETKTDSITDAAFLYIVDPFGAFNYNGYSRFIAKVPTDRNISAWTQEVRLVSEGDSPLSYVLGAYYQKHKRVDSFPFIVPGYNDYAESIGRPMAFPEFGDTVFLGDANFRTTELAGFGELTYKITDAWQITGGLRVFNVKTDGSSFNRYPVDGNNMDGAPDVSSGDATDKLFKVNTSYSLDSDNRIYATFSQGFRRGGVNALSTTGPRASLPEFLTFAPDFVNNYEIGIKGVTFDRRLSYAVSVYRLDWKDFQVNGVTPGGYSAVFNGAKARVNGLEVEGSLKATNQLTLSASYAYTDSKAAKETTIRDLALGALDDGFQPSDVIVNGGATILAGTKLPGVSKHSATGAIDYEIPVGRDGSVVFHVNANYRSSQKNLLATATPNFAVLPSAFFADARITYQSGRDWAASLFVTNLTKETAHSGTQGYQQTEALSDPLGTIFGTRFLPQPRTFGVSLKYGF